MTVPERHPLGRFCGKMLPLALLLMPYALTRYAIDGRRDRRGRASRPNPSDGHDNLPFHNLFRCKHPDCRRDAQAAQDATVNAPKSSGGEPR